MPKSSVAAFLLQLFPSCKNLKNALTSACGFNDFREYLGKKMEKQIMQYQNKLLWLTSLAAILAMSFMSGCNDPESKDIDVMEWKKVDENFFDGQEGANHLTISKDGSWIYVTFDNGKKLYGLETNGDLANAHTQANWKEIQLSNALDNSKGKAKLNVDKDNAVNHIVAASDGAFVSVTAKTQAENGAYYLKGKDYVAGWAAADQHIDNAAVANGSKVAGYLATKLGVEYPIIFDISTKTKAAIGAASLGTPAALNNALTRTGTGLALNTSAATMGNENFYIVDASGINVFEKAKIGEDDNVALPQAPTNEFAPDKWKEGSLDNSKPAAITATAFIDGKLYIGFPTTGDKTGGYAIHEEGTDTTTSAQDAWKGIQVIGFVKYDGKVWAVTDSALIEIGDDPTKKLDDAAVQANLADTSSYDTGKPGYKGNMPKDSITFAVSLGDGLVIQTADKGLFTLIKSPVKVTKN